MIEKAELVLFTGGRDSTLAACTRMLQNIPVQLLTMNSGCSLHREVLSYRVKELQERFGSLVLGHQVENISGSFRSIALINIESDMKKYQKNLILLGEKLAIHVHAVAVCKKTGLAVVNDGLTRYQIEFAEQRETARTFFYDWMAEFGIEYRSPIYDYATTEERVKIRLAQLGLSTKSLEGATMFADSFSTPSDEVVHQYLVNKRRIAQDILSFLLSGNLEVTEQRGWDET